MNLETFLYNLHFDIDKARPLDLEVDWQDAPLTYKLYRHLPVVPLSQELPPPLTDRAAVDKPSLKEISDVLWLVYGLTQVSQLVTAPETPEQSVSVINSIRRFVPSGGGLYPNELYVYLKLEDEELPYGIYHYDVAHHRLVLLRAGNFDSYLEHALGHRCHLSFCYAIVFVSTFFWKNFFKYHDFAYRLQGLDAGVLIGQLLEVAKRYGSNTGVYFQFLDRAVNHLLGLSEQEESVYAMVVLSKEPVEDWLGLASRVDMQKNDTVQLQPQTQNQTQTQNQSNLEIPKLDHSYYIRSRRIRAYPMLTKMNEASLLETLAPSQPLSEECEGTAENPNTTKPNGVHSSSNIKPEGQFEPPVQSNPQEASDVHTKVLVLPKVERMSYDFVQVCRKRYSPGIDFQLGNVSLTQLARLLHEATASFEYRSDLDQFTACTYQNQLSNPRVFLYCCLYHVDGIADGAYRYDKQTHALQLIQAGDQRFQLQEAMSMHNLNLSQVPICLHVVGETQHYMSGLGYRGYRIQQMEVGMLVQRLLLKATALGMGGHPLLGYEPSLCDDIYKLNSREQTCLIQIPVGPFRDPPRLTGSLR